MITFDQKLNIMSATNCLIINHPMKKNNTKRLVIYTKDVELLTGKSAATARRLLQQIRQQLGKEEMEFVTIQEFCFFTGIPEDLVLETLT